MNKLFTFKQNDHIQRFTVACKRTDPQCFSIRQFDVVFGTIAIYDFNAVMHLKAQANKSLASFIDTFDLLRDNKMENCCSK